MELLETDKLLRASEGRKASPSHPAYLERNNLAMDINTIEQRISRVLRGQVRRVDIKTSPALRILEHLQEVRALIGEAIIPSE